MVPALLVENLSISVAPVAMILLMIQRILILPLDSMEFQASFS